MHVTCNEIYVTCNNYEKTDRVPLLKIIFKYSKKHLIIRKNITDRSTITNNSSFILILPQSLHDVKRITVKFCAFASIAVLPNSSYRYRLTRKLAEAAIIIASTYN